MITVIGSLNMDLVVRTPKIPRAGETLAGSAFQMIPGGKGANQAVAAARVGAVTQMVGCVGQDAFGQELLKSLTRSRVEVSGVETGKKSRLALPPSSWKTAVKTGLSSLPGQTERYHRS